GREGGSEAGGGKRHAAADQADTQQLPPALEPALERSEAPTQLLRRLVPARALQAAEDERGPQTLWQPLQFFIQRLPHLPPGQFRHGVRLRHVRGKFFAPGYPRKRVAPQRTSTEVPGDADRDPVEPAAQGR